MTSEPNAAGHEQALNFFFNIVNAADGIGLAQCPVEGIEKLRVPLGVWEDITVDGQLTVDTLNWQALNLSASRGQSTR